MADEIPTPDPEGEEPIVEQIRRRAHEISEGPDAGTPEENWLRAERELSGAARAAELEQAREEEADVLRSAHWFTQSHP